MNAPLDPMNPPDDLEKLFENARLTLEAVDPAHFIRRLVGRARVLELSNILLGSWAALHDQLDEELSPERAAQRKAELEGLDRRAWVYYAAELAAGELHADTARKQRLALAKAVAEHDRFLFKWASPLWSEHPEHGPTLSDISRGTGTRDDAEDVLRLVALFRREWKVAKVLPFMTGQRLEEAAADATKQLDLLRNGPANPARKLADAAYSLWYRDYDELMQLGRYLSRREADASARFPGVREVATRSASEPVEAQAEDQAQAQAQDQAELPTNAPPAS